MNKELAKELLFDIDDIFKKYNITFWLDCGTLLGAVRNLDFIDWDNDLDIAVYKSIFLDYELWNKVIQDFLERNIHVVTTWGDSVFSCKKYKNKEEMVIDIHTYKKVNKEYQCAMSNNLLSFPEEIFDSLSSIDFKGRQFNTPNLSETYLALLYGDNWKEPHPDNTIWTSKNNSPYYHSDISTYVRNIPIFKSGFSTQDKVSIIIPCFNRVELLEHTLNAYVEQDKPFPYEIIILNDYLYDDATINNIATESLAVRFLKKLNILYWWTGQRHTPSEIKWRIPGFALNIGAKLATGNILVLTCPEIYPMTKDCLLKTVTPLFTREKIVTHPISVKDDRGYRKTQNENEAWILVEGEFLKDLEDNNEVLTKTEADYEKLEDLKPYYPFFLALHKKEYLEIGGYDEDFIGNCYDDVDFYNRLKLNGCTFLPTESKVLHLYHQRLNYTSEQIQKDWNYNKTLYEERKDIIIRNSGKEWGKR